MRIAFYQPHLCLHGTTVSMFDYANYNQTILGNKSIVFYDADHELNNLGIIKKFRSANIQTIGIQGSSQMEKLSNLITLWKAKALYIQKCGKKDDGRWVDNVPCFIHCVGRENDPHGHVYAYVSDWLSRDMTGLKAPVVPYMAHLPDHNENFREELGIPKEATVFSRMGGYYSWNIPFVEYAISEALDKRDDVYFLFTQTNTRVVNERVIHVEPFADLHTKRKFINTSDAFLHARNEGESFGMAVAEYSICNKPVITWANSPERNHIETLGDKGMYYTDLDSLIGLLLNFQKDETRDFNAYSEFTPEKVIQKFKEVFLDKL